MKDRLRGFERASNNLAAAAKARSAKVRLDAGLFCGGLDSGAGGFAMIAHIRPMIAHIRTRLACGAMVAHVRAILLRIRRRARHYDQTECHGGDGKNFWYSHFSPLPLIKDRGAKASHRLLRPPSERRESPER